MLRENEKKSQQQDWKGCEILFQLNTQLGLLVIENGKKKLNMELFPSTYRFSLMENFSVEMEKKPLKFNCSN